MDKRRARTALYAYLLAANASGTYAFTPSVRHVASLEGRRRGGESRHGHRRGHEHTSTVGTRHLTLPPSSPSLPRNSRPTSRLRSSTTNNNDSKNANSNGAANPNTNSLAAAAASATNFNSPDSAATGSSTSASTAAGDTIPAAAIANPARRGASTLSQGPSDGGSAASGQSVVRRVRPAMALGLATAGQGVAGVDGVEGAASAAAGAVLARNNRTERGQRLRALNWAKQVRNELTSAEFALNLNGAAGIINGRIQTVEKATEGTPVVSGKRGGLTKAGMNEIDFDSIAERLEASLRSLQAGRPLSLQEAISEDELRDLTERLKITLAKIKKITQVEGRSKGSSAGVDSSGGGKGTGDAGGVGEDGGSGWRETGGRGLLDDMKGGINVNLKDVKVPEFDLFVRDDGTVDWDGAIQSGREVARFGQELWERINGQNPEEEGLAMGSHGGGEKTTKELPDDSPVMLTLNSVGAELEKCQDQLQKELDALKADARAQEATWQGLDRRNAQRRMRDKEKQLNNSKRQLQLHRIDVDMERICYNIEQEIRESTVTSSSEYRLLVAEFGLLDAQLANLTKLVAELTGEETGDGMDGVVIDEDELELVSREVLDLKNRLGMDLENPVLSVDPEKVTRYLRETYDKIKSGVDFYWTGTNLLGNDVGYALTLVTKAAQGSILKPREVRTLRRTAKDCMTFIPFVIILIFPLTPIGHVLVFSFIQRFFPDFFPSTYTDRRQNLLKMYTEVEKKVDWEVSDNGNGDAGDDILENLRRNFIATLNKAGDQQGKGGKQQDR